MAQSEMGKLPAYAKAHGIRFFGKFVTLQLLSTFQVKILPGASLAGHRVRVIARFMMTCQ